MATEYKLSYTGAEINEKLGKVDELSDSVAYYITPEKYGAVGDGVTDDSAAIQAAIDAAGGSGTVYLQNKTYLIETGIIINSAYAKLVCDGLINYTGTGSAVAIKPTGGASLSRVDVRINRIEAENGTGVILDASDGKLTSIYVDVNYIYKSKIGIQLLADNEYYISYGMIKSKDIKATETGIHVENKGSGEGISFLNEVCYYLGRIQGGCTTGVKLINAGAHKFMSGSFEGLADDATSLYLENASDNMFRNFRWAETYGSTRIKFVGDCHYNDIEGSRMTLSEIDISELAEISGQYNILRAPFIMNKKYGYRCGNIAYVNKQQGITYVPNYDDNSFERLTTDTALDETNVIGCIENRILTSVRCDHESIDGLTYTLSDIYSGYTSAARGYPISFEFGAANGRIKLVDAKGDTIIDNTNGEYAGKTVTVKWCGYNYNTQKNTWLLQEQGEIAATQEFVRECLKSQSGDFIVQSNSGNEYKIVVTDGGQLTTVPAAEINQVPVSKDTDGTVYNGTGYIDGYRINSSGVNAEASNTLATGYIHVTGGDTVRMSGWALMDNLINENAFAVYDDNYTNLGVFTAKNVSYGIFSDTYSAYGFSSITETDGVYSWSIPVDANIAYIRISAYKASGATLSVIVDGNAIDQTPIVDTTLTKEGVPADAKVTGEKIGELSEAIAELDGSAKTYVQAEEPTDAAVGTLWYDTDEFAEDDDDDTSAANEKLTFTGAVTAEYDGTKPVTVDIPTGGSGGYSVMELLIEETIDAETTSWSRDIPACDVVEIILVNKSETAITTSSAFHRVTVNKKADGTYPSRYPIKLAKDIAASKGWGMWRIERRNGFAILFGYAGITSSGEGVNAYGVVTQPMFPSTGAPITDASSFAYIDKIDAVTLNMTIPAGVEIRVYGLKQEG